MSSTSLGRGAAKAITRADIARLADELAVHPAKLEAIAVVESQGFGWFGDGRVKILFEKHWFYKLLPASKRAAAVKLGIARKTWISPAKGGYKQQATADQRYALLAAAMRIDEDAALQSISIGRFQIMGFNYKLCGFASVQAMWKAFLNSEVNQLRAFKNFLVGKKLLPALRAGDFDTVETGYNGGGQNGAYARKMEAEFNRLLAGKWKGYKAGGIAEPEVLAHPADRIPAEPEIPVPELVPVTIPGLDKPIAESSTVWSSIGGVATTVLTAIAALDWKVAVPVIVVAAAFGGYIIWNRQRQAQAQVAAVAAAAGKTL